LPLQTAGETSSDDIAAAVRSLVRELDASQRAVRDDAERQLIELGPTALPLLPAAQPTDSAERTLRLNRVRLTLLRNRAAAALQASRVSLQFAEAPLAEVLAEIELQTGNKLIDYRRQFGQQADELRVSLDLHDAPFWQAVDQLCAAAGLTTYAFAGEEGLALVARTAEAKSSTSAANQRDAGAFRVKVRRLTTTADLDAETAALQLELEVAWEPRLKPLFVTLAAADLRLVTDAGDVLLPTNPQLVLEVPPQGRASQIGATCSFVAPPRSARSLRSVAGTISVLIPAEMHVFRFADLDAGERREQQAAAVNVTLEPLRKSGNLVEFPVRIRYHNPSNALESHRAWFYKNPAYLETGDGRRTSPGSTELARQADNELLLKLMFVEPADLSSQTFVYQTPADLVALPVKFEFAELPLP